VPTPPTPPAPPVEQPPPLAPPAEPARPVFAWSDVGTYLLSERTLHALLGLGAFLILASGVVISTVNPTNLGPILHLGAVMATSLLFYLAGYVVRQKLNLRLTGTVLLAIGGAFIPLAIWTLGQDGLLNWQPDAIWLATSLFCLPLYLASHLLLRDHTFALLTSLAGGSQLLAALNWLGLPLEWGLCALLVLALSYLRLAHRLRDGWPELAWALARSTRVTTPLVLGLLLLTKFFPAVYEVATGRAPGVLYEYAAGAAWWLGTAFYALAARLFERRRYAFLAAWTLPFAFLLTLARAPWEASWYNVGLALLALGYLGYGRWRQRLLVGESRPGLGAIVRQPAYQVSLALTFVALLWPLQSLDSRVATLGLVTVLYALAARLFLHVAFRYLASYLPPFALGFTLQRLEQLGLAWAAPAWQNVAYALLALGYLLLGRRLDRVWWASGARPGYRLLLVEPLFQVALLLTAVAGFWPLQARPGEIVTLLVLAFVYAAATFALRQRAWAYVAVYLLPIADALVERELQLQPDQRPLGWTGLAATLVVAAELAVRRTGEARRPLLSTIIGRGAWRSRFAAPFFSAGYALCLLALGLGLERYWQAPVATGTRLVGWPVLLALFGLVAISSLSAVGRRTSFPLYPATWLLIIPFSGTARALASHFGLPLVVPDLARLLGGLGLAYLVSAYLADRVGGHYSKPIYLAGYGLLPVAMLLSVLDRTANTQLLGLNLLIWAVSACLVHRGRHTAYLWVVERLFPNSASAAYLAGRALFLYMLSWSFPVWLLLALSLWQPAPMVAQQGLVLTLLAVVYAGLGHWMGRSRPEYRWPSYLAGYALSVIGPLVATPDPTLRVLALALTIAFYVGSTAVSHHSAWLYPVALLTPVLLWQALERFDLFDRHYGLGLVGLGLAYGCLGLLLHQGDLRGLIRPLQSPIGRFGRPFLIVGCVLSALGLARVANQGPELVVIGFLLGAATYGGAAAVFRQSIFGYPLVATLTVAYLVGLTLTPLEPRLYGLGLLPGLAAYLAVAELLRRRADRPAGAGALALAGLRLDSWSLPFYAVVYLGTIAVPWSSHGDQTIWALAWWSVAAVYLASTALFRHPGWLYLAVGTGLIAFLATVFALAPSIRLVNLAADLIAPTWLLFGLAYSLVRRPRSTAEPASTGFRWTLLPRGLGQRWAAPLLVYGWGLLPVTIVGTLPDAGVSLRTAGLDALLLIALALLWQGSVEVWASLILGMVAYQQALRLLEIPLLDQPARWAVAALLVGLIAIALKRRSPKLRIWVEPLYLTSIGLGALAMLGALVLVVSQANRMTLPALAATVAPTGLALIAHGFDRRERRLSYLGVGLLEVSYMLQLLFFEVGQPQAFVLPAGLYLLAIAYLEWRRGTGAGVKPTLEAGALALLLGSSLLQAVGFLGAGYDRYTYDTFLLVESVVLFGFGAVLHWRRSFLAGALAIVLDVLILLADPLRAMNTWYLAGVIGLLMIGLVIFVERQRQRIPFWVETWRLRLESWD
jgi:hypothetical protein